MKSVEEIKEISTRIKRDVIQLTSTNTGHPGGAIGAADIIAELYFNRMNHDPQNVDKEDRDRFVLSNGHICAALYSAMARSGYFELDELYTFRKINSRLQGHPSRKEYRSRRRPARWDKGFPSLTASRWPTDSKGSMRAFIA